MPSSNSLVYLNDDDPMFNPGMLQLNLFTGLITGIVLALILRIRFRPMNLSLLIIGGSVIGSFLTNALVYSNPQVSHYLFYELFWKLLWQPLGAGASSGFSGLFFSLLTMVIMQIIGSFLGGLLGLRIWRTFFRV
jgi:hypothetical protein